MAKIQITVSVDGKGDVQDDALALRVVREQGWCAQCAFNEDPYRLPLHAHCRCDAAFAES